MMIGFLLVIFACSQLIKADNLYTQGFYDLSAVPGVAKDTEENYPFITSTNRQSDGISSTSAYTTTSPRTPDYHGAPANVTDRYLDFTRYAANAAEQGVALAGLGDAEIEAARLTITSIPNFELLPRPSKVFPVYAAIKWNPSHFAIQEGERYRVDVFDLPGSIKQYWSDGGIRVTPDGYTSYFDAVSNCFVGMGRCRPHLKKRRRLPSANWLSLACAIGEFVRPLTEAEPGKEENSRYLPLDESQLNPTIFDVGLGTEFRASYSGQLICFANDAHMLYWNNYGQIEVNVTRITWPPLRGDYYEPQRDPSCDSAQVVYANLTSVGADQGPTDLKCNLNGGGTGWSFADVHSTTAVYSSGAPESTFYDLPSNALADISEKSN